VPRSYDPEFRRRVVELVRAGRPVRVAVRTARTRLAIPPSFHPAFELFHRQDRPLMTPAQAMALRPHPEAVTYE
jgi:hypothetical protein